MKIVDEYESNLEGEGINIVPMIDVIFAILTFFIISSLDLIRLDNIPVNLPKASTSTLVKDKPIVLTIDRENNIFLENKPIDSKILVDQIKNIISDYSTDILVISADKEVAYGKVVEVIDQVRSIDNLRIGMSTENWTCLQYFLFWYLIVLSFKCILFLIQTFGLVKRMNLLDNLYNMSSDEIISNVKIKNV